MPMRSENKFANGIKGHTAKYRQAALDALGISGRHRSKGAAVAIRRKMQELAERDSLQRYNEVKQQEAERRRGEQKGSTERGTLTKEQKWARDEFSNGQRERLTQRIEMAKERETFSRFCRIYNQLSMRELFNTLDALTLSSNVGFAYEAKKLRKRYGSETALANSEKDEIVHLLAMARKENFL